MERRRRWEHQWRVIPHAGPGGRQNGCSSSATRESRRRSARYPGQAAVALAGVPAADDAVWCLGEVASNAVVHSRSGQPGGSFTVAADVYPGALVAIVVTDQGGPWTGRAADTCPHGLEVVRTLATDVRIDGDDNGRSVWVILPWGQDAIPILNDSAPRNLDEAHPPAADPSGRQNAGGTWPLHSSLKLGTLPGAAGCAEAHARLVAAEWGLSRLSEAAGRVAAEMIERAVRASGTLDERPPVWLWLRSNGNRILVAVWDGRPEPPAPADEPQWPPAAQVTEERGWHRHDSGKTCWAVLSRDDASPAKSSCHHQNPPARRSVAARSREVG
jgi:anti-sigma regulatory factor (Ser/Thr protein kinase)